MLKNFFLYKVLLLIEIIYKIIDIKSIYRRVLMRKILTSIILIMIIIIVVFIFFSVDNKEKIESVLTFNIAEISIYSGAGGENVSENYQNPEWNLNIYQYSDIAIYLERILDFNDNNNIKNIYIDNIKLGTPRLGTPKLYYLNPLEYGSDKIIESNEIVEKLEFDIINSANKNNDIGYSIPILFQDLSNPITLKYVNSNIVNSFKISNDNKLIFNGSLLKKAQINPKDIENQISFCINIKTGDDRIITKKIEISIPLEDNDGNSIYDGNIQYKNILDLGM